ncbi:calcium-binding protein [Thalassobius sp. Cn5-15]|uniref:calcium-binding protein n=1 Tax=Thalassobius sp. Cn5-15 TaxID=2917763 RepID=UPI001EF23AB8|nr:calcium-binding protein [Thalassobius sp. Cn5-15]MCG7493525.1 hypothetical protein [Thalassobius sp. Cn5-15]
MSILGIALTWLVGYLAAETLLETTDEDEGSSDNPDSSDGSSANDSITGSNGADVLLGFDGADLLQAGAGDDTVYGGAGDDQVFGQEGSDNLRGGNGNDSLYGGSGADLIVAGQGNDFAEANAGEDTIYGNEGNDFLSAVDENLSESDAINGGAGDDRLWGGDGDTLVGGEGLDKFDITVATPGATPVVIQDFQNGEPFERPVSGVGDKAFYEKINFVTASGELLSPEELTSVDAGNLRTEALEDGPGYQVIVYDQVVAVVLGVNISNASGSGWVGNLLPNESGHFDGDDTLLGSSGDDTISAGPGNDYVEGNGGSDEIYGWRGNDFVSGVDADGTNSPDWLNGGSGDDTLRGDAGDTLSNGSRYVDPSLGESDGKDQFEVVVSGGASGAPVNIYGFESSATASDSEIILLTDAEGVPLSADELEGRLSFSVYSTSEYPDEIGAISLDGDVVALIYGFDPDHENDISVWLGNLSPTG